MRTIIAGSRSGVRYRDVELAVQESGWADEITVVVSGMCPGKNSADMHGIAWAEQHGLEVDPYPANWSLGRHAGPVRNRLMALNADALIAISADTPGTRNMICEARNRGLKVFVRPVTRPGEPSE